MSTIILRNILNKTRHKDIKIFSVDIKTEALGDYVRRKRREKNLSILDVEKISRTGGAKGISNGYITQIESGTIKNVSPDKLKALAKGLSTPEHEILTVAGFKNNLTPESSEVLNKIYGHFSGWDKLDDEDKQEIEPMFVMIANDIARRIASKRGKNK